MTIKHIVTSSVAALAFSLAGAVAAEQPATPFVSGDEPMNVGQGAQMKAPDPNAKAQETTEKVIESQGAELTGDYAVEQDDAQIKAPTPNAQAQEATEKVIESQGAELTGDYPIDEGDAKQMAAPKE
ncbi:hypothetical protein G3480_19275 [Thiorhodococcus mannitoliphagus]|uniref:DUF4148 domain-containing protein n=1 Tax=Thiorhodococcus mannitoliphagus TaxID=329406 RepID=A0A6P1E1P3_9GAMM|nr:hypothetical protein [Thiorhodococcus mannitoliphagus]NEX22422.1 hypothetical protein [Thiorhodococcus mannitoliphagus]